jgi:hypothetical protein
MFDACNEDRMCLAADPLKPAEQQPRERYLNPTLR